MGCNSFFKLSFCMIGKFSTTCLRLGQDKRDLRFVVLNLLDTLYISFLQSNFFQSSNFNVCVIVIGLLVTFLGVLDKTK